MFPRSVHICVLVFLTVSAPSTLTAQVPGGPALDLPDVDLEIPPVSLPGVVTGGSGASVSGGNVSGSGVSTPSVSVFAPRVDVTTPAANVSTPPVGVQVPGTGVDVQDALDAAASPAQALLAGVIPGLPQLPIPEPAISVSSLPNVVLTGSALVDSVLSSAASLTSQIADFGLDASGVGGGNGRAADGVGAAAVGSVGSGLSAFTFSGASRTEHDGFSVASSSGGRGETPGFESIQYGLTLGVRADASRTFGLARNTLSFGLFGNVQHADIDIDGYDGGRGADASVETWGAGGYALATDGSLYALVTVMGSWGDAEVDDFAAGATGGFDTSGFATQAVGGALIPVTPGLTLDARGGLTYVDGRSNSHVDSIGTRFGAADIEEVSGNVSLKLFSSIPVAGGTMRPFAQGGVTHRFDYDNTVVVEGTELSFTDADTTVSGRLGVDFDMAKTMQGYVAVRGDKSEDLESVGGQVGLTLILN